MTWDAIWEAFFPSHQGSTTLAIVYWAFLALLAGLEFFVPQLIHSERSERWPANIGLGLINMALIPLAPVSALWAAEWAQRNGIGLLNALPASWWVFAAATTIVVQSFVGFAVHFLMHKTPWLWRVHRVHHLDVAVDVTTGLRHHPIEFALALMVDVTMAVIFGLVPWMLVAFGSVAALFALATHANIRIPKRLDHALRPVFVTPRIHAIHHSSHQPETDSNYGNVIIVWDRLFGTYSDARADRPEVMQFGLAEVRDGRASDLWWQLKSPSVRLDAPASPLSAQPESEVR
jgi:sterol desaturase/sphingolipid hydroxylase (fatty acid hydroxylase superfamily)